MQFDLEKIAGADIDAHLVKAASVLRSQASTINELQAELAKRDRRDEATKIASIATERGVLSEEAAADWATSLAESDKDLDIVEDFVSRSAPGMPLGEPKEKVAGVDSAMGSGEDALSSFLMVSEYSHV